MLRLLVLALLLGGLAGAQEPAWVEASDLTVEGRGWPAAALPSPYARLPARAEGLVPEPVWGLSRMSAGLSVRFVTTSPRLRLAWTLTSATLDMAAMPATGVSGIDVYARLAEGWRFVGNGRPLAQANEASFALPPASEYRLYLPLYNGVESVRLAGDEGHAIGPAPANPRPTILFYGTSILQGALASRPGLAAVARVGRALEVPTINLGFSGSARGEPAVAALLAEVDAAIYVLDPLWNMWPEELSANLPPLVHTLRAAHPSAPIVLVEDTDVHNDLPSVKGPLLREIRAQLEAEGLTGLHLLAADGMLGLDSEGTVDGLHPNDVGFARQAEKYLEVLRPLVEALVRSTEGV